MSSPTYCIPHNGMTQGDLSELAKNNPELVTYSTKEQDDKLKVNSD